METIQSTKPAFISGTMAAASESRRGVSAPVSVMPTVPSLANIFSTYNRHASPKSSGVVSFERRVDQIGDTDVFLDRLGQQPRKLFVEGSHGGER